MLLLVSEVWGLLAMCFLIAGFWPVFIAINWLNLPFATIGLLLSVFAILRYRGPRNAPAVAGLMASLIAVIIGVLRLAIGSSPL